MEKKSVTNERFSNNYLHDDIVFSILSKLPLKSLKRFECVNKSWSLLFENPNFVKMIRNNFLSKDPSCCHDASLLLHMYSLTPRVSDLYSLSGERCENMVKLHFPDPFQQDTQTLHRLHCYDFINLCSTSDFIFAYCSLRHNLDFDIRVALWNPTTEDFKVIPPHTSQPYAANASHDVINFHSRDNLHGFGYDRVTNDYKMISYVTFAAPRLFRMTGGYVPLGDHISLQPLWEIYSLKSNSWRKLDIVMPSTSCTTNRTRAYMNGVCHWWCIQHFQFESKADLVSFDLSNETFITTPIPLYIDDCTDVDDYCSWRHLAVLNGSISLFTYHEHMATFKISVLGELSVKESWTKLFILGPLPCIEYPIGFGKGKIFFIRKDKEVAWYDLNTLMIEELGVKGDSRKSPLVVYKENLPISGIKK